jgi:hypothetical protein
MNEEKERREKRIEKKKDKLTVKITGCTTQIKK